MLHNMEVKPNEIIGEFTDSVETLIDQMFEEVQRLKDLKESDLTKSHYLHKMINKWFERKGNLKLV